MTHPKSDDEIRRVLLVAPECAPMAKAGGLADVVAALPKVLRRSGVDARVVIPLYSQIDRRRYDLRSDGTACVHLGDNVEHWIGLHTTELDGGVPLWLIEYADYYSRPGIYGDPRGEYRDNAYRFALLSKAAMQVCKDRQFIPDVMHLHDWPSAPAAVFLKTWDRVLSPLSDCASVLTIHNIGHQGKYPGQVFGYFGVGAEHWNSDTFEDFGQMNLLKGGVRFSDAITTVSPTHLREILSAEGGHGLAPYLNRRLDDLAGILNGADYEHWTPEKDPYLPSRYSVHDLAGKAECRRALQRHFGLELRDDLPIFGLVSRLVLQKGMDLLIQALPAALERLPVQVVILGAGEPSYEDSLRWMCWRFPGKAGCHIGYSEELSHLIEAGSDFFLMPSLYEPCGLNQLYSMKYGTLPVVRATGGLEDTVDNYDPSGGTGTGFKFSEPSGRALFDTLGWVVSIWFDHPQHIAELRRRAMQQDFSWDASARKYLEVYRKARARRRLWG